MEEINKIQWGGFEKSKGWDGLNNAAINSFNSNIINSFIREMFQNSNDARQDDESGNKKKLKIEIDYKKIKVEDFPEYTDFLKIVNSISEEPANKSHEQFFNQALEGFGKDGFIQTFIYKDFNTTGLEGADEDADSTFSACVLSEGTSVKKDETAGGSYGIGKNSIFGFSKIRTVLYSSLNTDGEKIFQGISKLASYKKDIKTYDYRSFLGNGNKFSSIRNYSQLPDNIIQLIDRDEPGLTQIAICPIESIDWVDKFTKAILTNYWLLIDDNQLEISLCIDEVVVKHISLLNLASLMLENFNPENFNPETSTHGNPYDFYKCYKECLSEEKDVHMLGKIKFHYQELPHKKTNSVAYIRNGMVIFSEPIWGFGSIGYCGVVICDSREGNVLLRMMEPPTHDKFDPSRLSNRIKEYDEKDGLLALEQTRRLIRDCLNKISDKYRKRAEEIPWLNNLLSSIKGLKGNGKGNRTGDISEKETIDRVTTEKKHLLVFSSVNRNNIVIVNDGEIPVPSGGRTPSPGPGPIPPPSSGPGPRPIPKPKKDKKAINFKSRIFRNAQSEKESQYKVLLTSDKAINGKTLRLFQVGDSGSSACFEIIGAKDNSGIDIGYEKILNKDKDIIAYKIKDVSIPNEILLDIIEPYKSTFKLQEF
jgi:hypothetical protein